MARVGVVAFGFENNGGVYQYTQSFVDALSCDDNNEYVIFVDLNNNKFDGSKFEVRKVDVLNRSLFKKIFMFFCLLALYRPKVLFRGPRFKDFEDIDVFFSPMVTYFPHFLLDKPYFFTLHDFQERYFPRFFSIKERVTRWVINRALSKYSAGIVCESNWVKNDAVKFLGVDGSDIHVIPAPPPASFYSTQLSDDSIERIRFRYQLPSYFILYPAQFWPHKNHLRLIEAFKKICAIDGRVCLVLTGAKNKQYDQVLSHSNRLGIDDRVVFLGHIPYEDLSSVYSLASLLVMPTLFESISIPIYEAFSLKIPVCCSNVVALPEQVGDAALIFNPYDVGDIASKVLAVLTNERLAESLVERGYNRVSQFDHNAYSLNLIKLLSSVR